MAKKSFISEENVASTTHLFKLNRRLFSSLQLFQKLFPLTVLCVLLGAISPSFFRWYAGKYTGSPGGLFTLFGLICVAALATLLRIAAWVLFEATGMWASQGLYSAMIKGLSETRTTFFDENPSGRIINRLIRDYDEVRSTAIIFVGDFFSAAVEILSIAGVACFATPWAIFMLLPLLFIFFIIQKKRSVVIEHCRAISASAASQVLNRKNDLIEGREIYLLYGKSDHLLKRMTDSLRMYLRTSLLTTQVDISYSFVIRCGAEVFSFFVLIFMIGAIYSRSIDFPIAGVIISALFGMTGSIGWLDFASSLVSRSAPHLRRVFEFIDLPKESSEELSPALKKAMEPVGQPLTLKGDIRFENYTMSYRKGSPIILDSLNLIIPEGRKTALVGRTGSGKSSIFQALMRMVYVVDGDILIGGQSIFLTDSRNLRKHFGVVPQFPYLFEGQLRSNLDRTGTINEERLQRAMQEVGLSYSLDHPIYEGGRNLSLGERQLICLARVIANRRPIILMDEPTSGLDLETDARIASVLHTALKNTTVLTIAHRKSSLKNYDFIVEMSGGKSIGNIAQI